MQVKHEKENNYIIKNYRDMTYKKIAEHLGISHNVVCARVAKLRNLGEIGRKNQEFFCKGDKRHAKVKPMPVFEFKKGDKYKHCEYCRGAWTKRKCIVLGDYKEYVLVQFKNYKETILKVNLWKGIEKLKRVD